MRVLFLEIDTERSWAAASIGPAFIGAYLRTNGHEVAFARARYGEAPDQVAERLAAIEPDVLGVSLTSRQWQRARALVPHLRERLNIPVVAGGLHPTFEPDAVLASPGFDFLCLGEGEAAMLDLVGALEAGASPRGIANIWPRGEPRPSLRPPHPSLDELPFMARDLLDEATGVAHMVTQRGCPFGCTYCAARMYNQLYECVGEYGRRRSPESVVAELLELRRADRLAYVIYLDDTFTVRHRWVKELCRLSREQVGVSFSIHARVDTVTQALLETLKEAGCAQITYGVESGSERVRREIMKRPISDQQIRDAFRWTREAGIAVTANYMLGLPGETADDIDRSLTMAEELEVLDFGYFVFYPYPGTRLFELCRERGYLPADYLDREANHRETILTLPELSAAEISSYYDRFTELRRRLYVERLGREPDDDVRDAATGHVDENARSG